MVGFRETLKHEAGELAFAEERKAGALRRKLARLDETRAKLKFDLDNAASAAARVHRYQPVIGETPQCPRCWILRAKQEPLVDQGSGGENDLFKCRECGHEVPFYRKKARHLRQRALVREECQGSVPFCPTTTVRLA